MHGLPENIFVEMREPFFFLSPKAISGEWKTLNRTLGRFEIAANYNISHHWLALLSEISKYLDFISSHRMHSSAFQNVYRQKNQKCNKLIWIPPNNYRCIISNVLILISRQICVGVSYKHFVRFVFIFWIKYRININWNENKAEIISIASQWLCSS